MKITLKALVSVLAIASLIIYTGCGGGSDPAPSVEDQQLEKLIATWNISDVTLDGVSKKTEYTAFSLNISGTAGATSFGYSTSGRPATSPWLAQGTWAFGANPESQIIRDADKPADKLDLTYSVSADGKKLQISFTFAGTGYTARTSNVKGAWVFTFTKP